MVLGPEGWCVGLCTDPPLAHRGPFSSDPVCCFQSFREEVPTRAEDGGFDSPGHRLPQAQARLARGVPVHPGQASARRPTAREAVRVALCGRSGCPWPSAPARIHQFGCPMS